MLKKSYVLGVVFCIFFSFICFDFISAKDQKSITLSQADKVIEGILKKNFLGIDAKHQQLDFLNKLDKRLDQVSDKNQNVVIFSQAVENTIKNLEIELSGVQKVVVGYSEELKEIYGYYKGDIDKDFLLITANSHGAYEYGTYLTALDLIEYFESQGKSQWFIIPTLNPDGLQIAIDDNFSKGFYLEGRSNANNVDINRNFCTKNFSSGEYVKTFGGQRALIGTGVECVDQLETQVIDTIFSAFSFSQMIDIHSLGAIIFIPDGGFNDQKVLDFANNIQQILGNNYDFTSKYSNNYQKNKLIQRYEFDEGGKNIYTGVLAQYIYETYKIPAIILELQYHGRIEKKLRGIEKLLK